MNGYLRVRPARELFFHEILTAVEVPLAVCDTVLKCSQDSL